MKIFLTKFFVVGLICLSLTSCAASSEQQAFLELEQMKASDYYFNPAQVALLKAIENGSREQMLEALDDGADVNDEGSEGMVPLFWALAKQNIDSFQFLLEQGADPNIVTFLPARFQESRAGALEMAARMEDSAYLRALLENKQ